MMRRLNHGFSIGFGLMMRSLRIIPFGGSLGSLNLSWVYSELAPQYPRIGRPSVDPVLMIRMLVVGYVFGIRSELA